MIALLREVGPDLERCELTHIGRSQIDVCVARTQHESYAAALRELGARVEFVESAADCPDGVFVEDIAVVVPEIAVVTQPGAASRRPEMETIAAALSAHRQVCRITGSDCLEGGDVLRMGRTFYVGASGRSNSSGIGRLQEFLRRFGYEVRAIAIDGCLHLKTACTFIPPHFLLANPRWVDVGHWTGLDVITVDEREPFAANTLSANGRTLVSAAFPRTNEKLDAVGILTRRMDISEFHKAEAGLTCLSLLLDEAKAGTPSSSAG